MGMFIALSVFGRGAVMAWAGLDVQLDTSPPYASPDFFTFMMLLTTIKNWELHGVTLAVYSYAMRHSMKVQIVTLYCVSHLQRYGMTVHGNGTSANPPQDAR
jgi:hypothetical protein